MRNLRLITLSILMIFLSTILHVGFSHDIVAPSTGDTVINPNDLYGDLLETESDSHDEFIHERMNDRIVNSILTRDPNDHEVFGFFETSRFKYLISKNAVNDDGEYLEWRNIDSREDDNRETVRRLYNYRQCMDRLIPCENHLVINRWLVPKDLGEIEIRNYFNDYYRWLLMISFGIIIPCVPYLMLSSFL